MTDDTGQQADVAAGQRWQGPNHSTVWVVFDGAAGLFDLWCEDPGTSTDHKPGSVIAGCTREHIIHWLDRYPRTH